MSEFLKPRLIGARFEGGVIPLEMLNDLAALGEMVKEVAKWRYLETHRERSRSPRGFTDEVSFKLTGVEKGSAVPVINMEFHSPQSPDTPQLPGMPHRFEEYFIQARDSIIEAIVAAELGEPTESILPQQYFSFFDRIGRRLREDESIEFSTANNERPARLTQNSRRRLVLASRIDEISQHVTLRGYIPEMDQDRMTFELQLLEGQKVGGVLHDYHREAILEVFNKYQDHGRTLIQGIGKYNRLERLIRLEAIEEVTILDPLDVPSRLWELRGLQDGWLDGEGVAPNPDLLDWLASRFDRFYPDELPLPYIYPTVEGGVQAEWSFSSHEVSLNISFAAREGEWHIMSKDTNAGDIETLSLASDNDWIQLVQRVQTLSGVPR